jgi:hypothetical protein
VGTNVTNCHITMEGTGSALNNITPGTSILQAGYHFKMTGSHPATTVSVSNAQYTIHVTCATGGDQHDIVFNLSGNTTTIAANAAGCDGWCPANDEHSDSVCQGHIVAPAVCNTPTSQYSASGFLTRFEADVSVTSTTCEATEVHFQHHHSSI